MEQYTTFKTKINDWIMASDLHCTYDCRPLCLLIKIAKQYGINAIAIIGDLFDKFHINTNCMNVTKKLREYIYPCIHYIDKNLMLVYIVSQASHDPILQNNCRQIIDIKDKKIHVYIFKNPVKIITEKHSLFLTHGEIIIRNGGFAFIINYLMEKFGKKLFLEKYLKNKINLSQNTWLIMGHTHIPGIDPNYRVINTGNWKEKGYNNSNYWRKSNKHFVIIKNEKIELISIDDIL